MPTSIEELERVHLRFIKVGDDLKLTEILSKILPGIINVFLEADLANADLDNPKIKAIEQILSHLMMRTKNSKAVNPPWAQLLDIFNQPPYLKDFENQNVKRHAANRIYEFIFESFDRIPEESDQSVIHVILHTISNDDLRYSDKCRLFLILLQKLSQYVKKGNLEKLGTSILGPIMTEDLKMSFMQMSLYYILNNIAPECLQQSIRQTFSQAIQEMSQRFKSELKETQTQFIQSYEDSIIKILGIQSIFTSEEILPTMLIASQSTINKTKESAELTIRGIFSSIDTKDTKVSSQIFRLVFSETYIYKDFSEREDQEVQSLPAQIQVKLIDYLIKFECSGSQYPLNHKLIFHCFFSSLVNSLESVGLAFVKHMIRYSNIAEDHQTVQYLRQTLMKILSSEGNAAFSEESQSTALHHLADMAMRNYEAINDDIDIAISTFDRLKHRIQHLEENNQFAIRNDTCANNYIETLNRLRDCYEEKLRDVNKRNLIVGYVLNSLNKESTSKTNSEIVYLLFLYLIRLDSGQFNSSVLLHSIILKDHPDIKIKREAQRQLDLFNQQMAEAEKTDSKLASTGSKRILRPFLKDIQIFLHKNHMNYIYDGSEYQLEEILTFNNSHFLQDFIEKMLEITGFAIRFYKEEQRTQDQLMDLGDQVEVQDKIERLLMMNLNQNFQLVKSDFSVGLNLIFQYLKAAGKSSGPVGALESIGVNFIFRLSQGTVNLTQRVLALGTLITILRSASVAKRSEFLLNVVQPSLPKPEKLDSLSHEQRLNSLCSLTLLHLFGMAEGDTMMVHLVESLTNSTLQLSPNIIEQIKFLTSCLKKLGHVLKLVEYTEIVTTFPLVVDYLINQVKRSEIDPNFRKYILQNLAGMLKKVGSEIQLEKAQAVEQNMQELDNADISEPVGRCLAKMNKYAGGLKSFVERMLGRVFSTQGVSLNVKRNSAIYLFQVVEIYGNTEVEIQAMFLEIQRVFLKFLFDRKSYMQDLSSKALSKIYNLGTSEVRAQLVENLSKTLSGEKSASEHQEKDENQELLLEFKDNTSTEQRDKLKTYKDLCNIAVELGHRELIYQFLEVHRHMAHYQDIKNAAKGLSSIIMLDEKLKGDLLRIAPRILLMSYDHNNEIKDTMKELWSSLIEIEKEEQIINSRWDEIFKEAMAGLDSKEYRRRQSSAMALSDLINQRTWPQIKGRFRDLFLTTLGLMDDQKDSVKLAAFQLSKTMKRITLKLGNIYTNSNVSELEEVLQIVIPMILDDCMKSTMKAVKFFAVDLLFDMIKTTQNHNMMKQLKVPSKHERQLVFNYNSEQKMKEIMNKFLDRIVIEVIANLSQMNKAVETINYFEQLAIEQGLSSSKGGSGKNKSGISEGELNDLRLKYTKESAWGEILKICRDQMTPETFNKILNDLLGFMLKGHDQITKSSAIAFVNDIILENKLALITPQNSRKIATKLVEVYQLNSVSAALSMKESIQNLYASCLGLQMKILKEYPKTVAQLVEMIVKLPHELDIVISLNIYEIAKNLPEEMLRTYNLLREAYPIIYINRFQVNDGRLKALCRKAHSYLVDQIPGLVENSQEEIFKLIREWLESSQYDNRVAASMAMQEITQKLSEEDLIGSKVVQEVIDKMHELIQGKYFNNKEQVVEGFMSLVKVANLANKTEFANAFVGETCLKQIEKNLSAKMNFKNQMIKAMNQILESSKVIKNEIKLAVFGVVSRDLRDCLQRVSEKASMVESMDEFEEKRVEEKETLQSSILYLESMPYLIIQGTEDSVAQQGFLSDLCSQYYHGTNWLVRNGILKCYLKILQLKKTSDHAFNFIDHLIQNVADLGEKYDANLTLVSDIITLFSEGPLKGVASSSQDTIRSNIKKVLSLLLERGTEDLMKNVDIIKRNIDL